MAMTAPAVSEIELSAFQASHFSATSTTHFAADFLGSLENQYIEDEDISWYEGEYVEAEDDGLGYYADGVKRTLTEEQIAIFRHSEIETCLRERRHAKEAKEHAGPEGEIEINESISTPLPKAVQQPIPETLRPIIGPVMDNNLEDDAAETINSATANGGNSAQSKSKKKKKQQKGQQKEREPKPKGFFRQNVKPDLRKRTWDVVEKGMEGLDYDDMDSEGAAKPSIAKRRQISYND